ncbi:hypothetical protein [Desulfosporosinus shakirovi]|uniref:hypothetical protein n=1 Tax=Desulfosporosinus shakirovi TaxID=2885154 RepID=UPI001E5D7428|nr:hypothetical protein [Desulfosporosinus sp. SRJS8]MCB8816151.1 hypothetical protein [Desulfosporosinus sp. SRJS8]
MEFLIAEDEISGVPTGLISMWSGAIGTIPDTWTLCDGTNGTPDLRDRFIVGAGSTYAIGNTGGSVAVTLTSEQLPSHSHGIGTLATNSTGNHRHDKGTFVNSTTGAHQHSYDTKIEGTVTKVGTGAYEGAYVEEEARLTKSAGSHTHTLSGYSGYEGTHGHTLSGSTASIGSGSTHENRPPYLALAYIMKL